MLLIGCRDYGQRRINARIFILWAENAIRDIFSTEADMVFYFTTHNLVYWQIWTHELFLGTLRLKMSWSKSRAMYAVGTKLNSVNKAFASGVIDTVQPIDLISPRGPYRSAEPLIELVKLRKYYQG
jgi:hypothetical protein